MQNLEITENSTLCLYLACWKLCLYKVFSALISSFHPDTQFSSYSTFLFLGRHYLGTGSVHFFLTEVSCVFTLSLWSSVASLLSVEIFMAANRVRQDVFQPDMLLWFQMYKMSGFLPSSVKLKNELRVSSAYINSFI